MVDPWNNTPSDVVSAETVRAHLNENYVNKVYNKCFYVSVFWRHVCFYSFVFILIVFSECLLCAFLCVFVCLYDSHFL